MTEVCHEVDTIRAEGGPPAEILRQGKYDADELQLVDGLTPELRYARLRVHERRLVCSRCGLWWDGPHRPGCEQVTAVPGHLFYSAPAGAKAAIRRWRLK